MTANILSGDSVTPVSVSPVGEHPPPHPQSYFEGHPRLSVGARFARQGSRAPPLSWPD